MTHDLPGHARGVLVALAFAAAGCAFNGDDQTAPRIGAIVPGRAGVGAIVTVEGDHFCPAPDPGDEEPTSCDPGGLIQFGGRSAIAIRWTDVAIDVEVPGGAAATVEVVVAIAGRRSNAVAFEILP